MYTVDRRDSVVELARVPQSSIGAPLPVVLADEHRLVLAYLAERLRDPGDGLVVLVVDPNTEGESVVIVEFSRYKAYFHGPPNDEAFKGHPLASRGLHPYGAFEVRESSWVRSLERMNRVHRYHEPERYQRLQHFIFAFHDSTFECVAEDFDISIHQGSMAGALPEMVRRLRYDSSGQ
jgi:hypothetical protein